AMQRLGQCVVHHLIGRYALKEDILRLFVKTSDGKKVYIKTLARSRAELIRKLGGKKFSINGKQYLVSAVKAEPSSDNTAVSMLVGGAIGLLGGVPGVIAGGAVGGLLGSDKDKKDKLLVQSFNRS
ncbi:hypothetical protein L9W97_17985, partial [Vibrio aestuarianus]|uniref:hypothetical protein n=1 Tax=Vibrio aestuarianus TaxID=28171 RepID=UPI00237C6051